MDADRFDFITRALATLPSRRNVLSLSLGGVLAVLGLGDAEGKNKKRKRRKRRKRKRRKQQRKRNQNQQQVVFNDFGCVDVGKFCQTGEQCCSGICSGAACQAHDASTCTPNQDVCVDEELPECLTTTGNNGVCFKTTGNASYCSPDPFCIPCTKDADCQPFCGPQAACVVCESECGELTGRTACVGQSLCPITE